MNTLRTLAALLLASAGVLAERVVLEDRFERFDAAQKQTLPSTGPRGSCSEDCRSEGAGDAGGLTLSGFGAVLYRIGSVVSPDRGTLEMEFTLRFAPDHVPAAAALQSNAATHTLFTLFVPGGRIGAWIDPGPSPQLGVSAYDQASAAHLFLQRSPVAWREGEKHRLTLSWGEYLRCSVDGTRIATVAFRGLRGPWGQTAFTDDTAIAVFGSLKRWVDTSADITLHRVTLRESSQTMAETLAAAGGVPGAAFQPSSLLIPRLAQAPTIDGVLTPGEWDKAAALTGLTDVSLMADMKQATTFFLGYDESRLYLACRCYRTQAETTDAACFSRDGSVFMDDAIEVYLMPAGGKDHIQFIGNSFGTIYDALNRNPNWNGNWQFKTRAEDACWTGELAIPFAELGRGTPAESEAWAVNFCRDLPEMSGFGSWSFLKGSFDQPAKFATARFSGSSPVVRLLAISGTPYAEPVLSGEVVMPAGAAAANPAVKGEVWLYDDSGVLAHQTLAGGGRETPGFNLRLKAPEGTPAVGEFLLSYLFTDAAGQRLLSGNYPFSTLPAFALATAMYPGLDEVDIIFDLKGMRSVPEGATARAALLDADARRRAVASVATVSPESTMVVTLPLRDVPPAIYSVLGELLNKEGRPLQSGRVEIEKKPAPWWQGRKAGVSDAVLPPWTPLSVDGAVVSCWGRQVTCSDSVLPSALVSQGENLLAGPLRLVAASGGQSYRLQRGECKVVSATPSQVRLASAATAGPFQVRAELLLEYDGFLRADLELSGAPDTVLGHFALEIPYVPEHSILLHHSTGGSGYAGMTYAEPWATAFLPMLWLGDDARGLAWFCESNRGWNAPGNGEIELIPGAGERLLRINFIREPVTLQQPRRFTFGFMATPVKPIPEHFRRGRLNNTAEPAPTSFAETLVYPAQGLLDPRQGSLEVFVQPLWPAARPDVGIDQQELLQISLGEAGPALSLTVQPDPAGDRIQALYTPVREAGRATAPEKAQVLQAKVPFPPGAFRQVALSWGDALSLYVDGVAVATVPQRGLLPVAAEVGAGGRLTFGDTYPWAGRAALAVDEFSIRRSALTPAAAAARAGQRPVADAETLLLDRYDEEFRPDGMSDGTTLPESGPGGGTPSLGCRFVPGAFGKALAIQAGPARQITELLVKDWKCDYLCDWSWNEHIGDPGPGSFAEAFRRTVQAYHGVGAKVYPYTINFLALRHPDHDYYINEWMAAPLRTWRYPAPEESWRNYDGDSCCPNSAFVDYFLASYEKTLAEFDLDGVYIDGSSKPDRCMNERHGCGWRDETGTLRGIYPIFAAREFAKRLYTLVHTRRPEGILDNHMSFNLFIPTSSFSDVIYTGEHEPIFRLDMLRARMASGPWGIPIEGLGSSEHVFSERQWAYYALHGAVIRPQGTTARDDMQRKTALLRDTLDEFRLAGAAWIPYHQANSPFTPLTAEVHVSAYQRADGQCLLIVTHLGKDAPAVARIRVAVPATSAVNALTQRPLALAAGVLEVPCGFEQLRLVRLR